MTTVKKLTEVNFDNLVYCNLQLHSILPYNFSYAISTFCVSCGKATAREYFIVHPLYDFDNN